MNDITNVENPPEKPGASRKQGYQKPELTILMVQDEIMGGAEHPLESNSGYYNS